MNCSWTVIDCIIYLLFKRGVFGIAQRKINRKCSLFVSASFLVQIVQNLIAWNYHSWAFKQVLGNGITYGVCSLHHEEHLCDDLKQKVSKILNELPKHQRLQHQLADLDVIIESLQRICTATMSVSSFVGVDDGKQELLQCLLEMKHSEQYECLYAVANDEYVNTEKHLMKIYWAKLVIQMYEIATVETTNSIEFIIKHSRDKFGKLPTYLL